MIEFALGLLVIMLYVFIFGYVKNDDAVMGVIVVFLVVAFYLFGIYSL